MSEPIALLGICGSLRRNSFNRGLLDALGEVLPPGVSLTLFGRLAEIPLYDADLEARGIPPAATELGDAIAAADGIVIATPEYNYSIPGVLKNAIDWVSRLSDKAPLRGKPCGILGASVGMGGTMRAQYHLRQVLVFTDTPVMGQPEVLVSHAAQRFSQGRLTDEKTRERLGQFAAALAAWTRRFKAGPSR